MKKDIKKVTEFHFFLRGWESQWHRRPMTIDGVKYNCCEQYMMAEKARLFNDHATLRKIMATTSPREQKDLGREVKNFDKGKWEEMLPWRDTVKPYCWQRVWHGNFHKFSQHADLREKLLAIPGTLVEVNPRDAIWGIGLAEDSHLINDPKTWQGKNWLGEVLTSVRDELK